MLDFEEIDYRETDLGPVSLRRRTEPRAGNVEVYEIKLGDEFLMSSLFTASEVALAELGIGACAGEGLEVAVGGLGLGYTAAAALDHPRLASLLVVEKLGPVIEWHRQHRVPLGEQLTSDARCRLVCGDFFALSASAGGFDHEQDGRRFDAILLDVDHSPEALLNPAHNHFYSDDGLRELCRHLKPDGVFALWSNDPPESSMLSRLRAVFAAAESHVVAFPNPYTGRDASCTVYVASR